MRQLYVNIVIHNKLYNFGGENIWELSKHLQIQLAVR